MKLTRLVLYASAAMLLHADVKLPALISEHMLVQRNVPVRIWGSADPGEAVTVSFQKQKVSTTADSTGKWQAFLAPMKEQTAGADMTIAGKNSITVADVLVGDVWIGSGQSNMGFTTGRADNAEKELAAADYPLIRLFGVKLTVADTPKDDVIGKWTLCTPETVKSFSAVLYFYGRDLHKATKLPMGLINTSWGGTPAQSWTSKPALEGEPALKFIVDDWQKTVDAFPANMVKHDAAVAKWKETKQGNQPRSPAGPGHQNTPAGLYNAMIAPLTPYAIKGAIWYQGEANASPAHAFIYRRLFRVMIEDWRQAWGIGAFPFYWVQLANYQTNGWWSVLRESQTDAMNLVNTGFASAIDIGMSKDIHPTNKQEVGRRLALTARHKNYGEKVEWLGPLYQTVTFEGGKARIWFTHAGSGLDVRGGGAITGFEIAGKDGAWFPAEAKIDGGNVIVSAANINEPAAVRYAWADDPQCNLINKNGLPANPFRTKTGSPAEK